MTTHTYRTTDVPVSGGELRVGIWEPTDASDAHGDTVPTVLLIHGITSSHLAFLHLVPELSGVRIIAPDLRGRARSNTVTGEAGMQAHATDLIAVLNELQIDRVTVAGHSMGGFVGVVLAHVAPERVDSLVLIDGGLPLDAPANLTPEQLVQAILGPTAARLSMTFERPEHYLEFWRAHPAFQESWDSNLDAYFEYDLVPEGDHYRSAASLATTTDDTIDLNTGTAIIDALQALPTFAKPVTLVTVPRGLQNEESGLYGGEHLEQLLRAFGQIEHVRIDDLNHYTIVMGDRGAAQLAPVIRRSLASAG